MSGLDPIRDSLRSLFHGSLTPFAGAGAAAPSEEAESLPPSRVGELSESLEDYLEIIVQLVQEKRVARVKEIAARKQVKMASVTVALKRLAAAGMVLYQAREFVELTEQGAALARKVLARHEFLRRLLREVLLVDPAVAEADACAMEHQLGPQTMERLALLYQCLMADPLASRPVLDAFRAACGNGSSGPGSATAGPAPLAETPGGPPLEPSSLALEAAAAEGESRPLSRLRPGEEGRVVRLRAGSQVRQRLVEMGVLPNVLIEMDGVSPLGDPYRVKIRGYRLTLRRSEADTIFVVPVTPAAVAAGVR